MSQHSEDPETCLTAPAGTFGKVSCFHYFVFHEAWSLVSMGPAESDLDLYKQCLDLIIASIGRLYSTEEHPQLLVLYHTRAVLEQGDLESQQHFLLLENNIVAR